MWSVWNFSFISLRKSFAGPLSGYNGRPLWPSPAHIPLQVYGHALNYLEEWQIVHRNNPISQWPPGSFLWLSLALTSLQNNLKPYLPAISIFLSQVSKPRRQAAVVCLHSAALFNKCQPGHFPHHILGSQNTSPYWVNKEPILTLLHTRGCCCCTETQGVWWHVEKGSDSFQDPGRHFSLAPAQFLRVKDRTITSHRAAQFQAEAYTCCNKKGGLMNSYCKTLLGTQAYILVSMTTVGPDN